MRERRQGARIGGGEGAYRSDTPRAARGAASTAYSREAPPGMRSTAREMTRRAIQGAQGWTFDCGIVGLNPTGSQ